jgi:predicted dehydrogenase
MASTLRGGVIGAGVFGGYHARQYASLSGSALAGVYDVHPDRAARAAEPHGARAFETLEELFAASDVITVASPATHHAAQALEAIAAGKPVYLEKPIATILAQAEQVRSAAVSKGVVVACGHQERVVFHAMGLLDAPEQPLLLEAVRHGPASPRSRDVSAVLDLMIHDLDLALAVCAGAPSAVTAQGARGEDGVWDTCRAEVAFGGGFAAVLDVSRTAPERRRTMRIVYPSGEVVVDFMARTLESTTAFPLNVDFAEARAAKDPLGASVEGFLQAVRGEAPRPVVTADEAIAALDLALRIEASLGAG